MDSIFAMLFLIMSGVSVLVILAYAHEKSESKERISKLTGIIDSYKKELAQKQKQMPERNTSLQINFRPGTEEHLSVQNSVLEKENQSLQKQLQDAKDKNVSLQTLLSKQSNYKGFDFNKVEFADRDFLMKALGENGREISQLRSQIAPLHHQIQQLKEKLHVQDDAAQQLDYLRSMYPNLDELLAARPSSITSAPGYNYAREYLSQNEWNELSDSQRNQLALDRYVKSHNKTKWQIGRDYELYVAHRYRQQGYDVDPCGSYLKLEDMGRDLILRKNEQIRIVQCKYWSSGKEINERFIFLLYGSVVSYCIENNLPQSFAKGIFVTNIKLSGMAKKCADALGVSVVESYPMGEFPRIKCNVTKDQNGEYVYIYHLPMDPQYDRVKIKNDRECYAYTVDEAESYGFRRAST